MLHYLALLLSLWGWHWHILPWFSLGIVAMNCSTLLLRQLSRLRSRLSRLRTLHGMVRNGGTAETANDNFSAKVSVTRRKLRPSQHNGLRGDLRILGDEHRERTFDRTWLRETEHGVTWLIGSYDSW